MRRLITLLLLLFASPSFAAITFSECNSSSTTADDITITYSPAAADDDVLLAMAGWHDDQAWNSTTEPDISGFSDIYHIEDPTNGQDTSSSFWYKVASSEPTSYTMNATAGGVLNGVGVICAFDGVNTTTPFDTAWDNAHYTKYNGGTQFPSVMPQAAPIYVDTPGSWVVIAQYATSNQLSAMGCPSGYTERHEILGSYNGTDMNVCTKQVDSQGTETPAALDLQVVSGTATNDNVGQTVDTDIVFATFVLKIEATGVSFSSGPTVAAATNGYTISGTVTSENATVYAVAALPSVAAPATCAAVQSMISLGSGEFSGSEAWTADVGDSFTITGTNPVPRHDVYVCADGTLGDTAVTTASDQNRSADTGQSITALTSTATTSPVYQRADTTGDTVSGSSVITGMTSTAFLEVGMPVEMSAGFDNGPYYVTDLTATSITVSGYASATLTNITVETAEYYLPTVLVGDVIEYDSTNSEGDTVTWDVDGDISWTDTCGGCQTTLDYCIQDISADTPGAFSYPDCWSADDTLYFFNSAPQCDTSSLSSGIAFDLNGSVSRNFSVMTSDPDSDAMIYALTNYSGALPTGLSFSSAGILSGTPTVEDETGVTVYFLATDPAQYGCVIEQDLYVIDTQTMPDWSALTETAAVTAYDTLRPWEVPERFNLQTITTCSSTEADGEVLTQIPVAGTELGLNDLVRIYVSNGVECGGRSRRRVIYDD